MTSSFDISLLYGRVGKIEGAQLGSFIGHASRDVIGAQLTGAASISGGNVSGSQLAGAGNLAQGTLDGLQISGAFNFARGSVAGAQITGALNIAARDLSGAQLAPINIAEETTGLQLGLVNVGRKVHGLQLGLVNIAEDVDGAAIGLVSISKDSIHPIAWTSNLEYLNAGIKFTTKYVFTIAAVHYGTHEGDFDNVGVTGGLGAHIPLPSSFDVELQGSVTQLIPRPSQKRLNGNVWIAPQVAAGYTFAPHLRAFAGGGARLPVSVDLGRDVVRPEVLAGIQF